MARILRRRKGYSFRFPLSKHTDRLYKYSEAQDVRDVDPRAQNEDLGDDPVRSSQLGIANLKRIVPQISSVDYYRRKGEDL